MNLWLPSAYHPPRARSILPLTRERLLQYSGQINRGSVSVLQIRKSTLSRWDRWTSRMRLTIFYKTRTFPSHWLGKLTSKTKMSSKERPLLPLGLSEITTHICWSSKRGRGWSAKTLYTEKEWTRCLSMLTHRSPLIPFCTRPRDGRTKKSRLDLDNTLKPSPL